MSKIVFAQILAKLHLYLQEILRTYNFPLCTIILCPIRTLFDVCVEFRCISALFEKQARLNKKHMCLMNSSSPRHRKVERSWKRFAVRFLARFFLYYTRVIFVENMHLVDKIWKLVRFAISVEMSNLKLFPCSTTPKWSKSWVVKFLFSLFYLPLVEVKFAHVCIQLITLVEIYIYMYTYIYIY